ncbi:MAG: MFS transporter [Frankiaceae bacterium]
MPSPLRRNRDFVLLQSGQLLSSLGSQSSAIAYPLLVLAMTGSASGAGVVGFAAMLPRALLSLPAGLAADRWNRRWLMVGADAVRAAAVGGLAAVVLLDRAALWLMALVAFVEGSGSALFAACQPGALRAVVPAEQLPAASGVVAGRQAAVQLGGSPLGGALFAVARALPFVVDAASYALSTASLLAVRAPFQAPRERSTASTRAQLAEGFAFQWRQPFLRACAIVFSVGNFLIPGVLLALVVVGERQGLSGAGIGLLTASLGAALLVGSLISPLVRRALPVRAVLLLELWTWLGFAAFLVRPDAYVLAGCLALLGLAIPSTDSVVHGYRIAMTPDRLLGRAEAARTTIALAIAPLGPLLAGALLERAPARAMVGAFAGCGVALAVWGSLSPGLRHVPRLPAAEA